MVMRAFIPIAVYIALCLASYDVDALVSDDGKREDATFYVGVFALNERGPCGGSLVDRKYVLTLARCVDETPVTDVYVEVGLYDYKDGIKWYNDHEVEQIIIHPNHNLTVDFPDRLVYDVALLKLKRIARVGKKEINPIAMVTDEADQTIRDKERRCYIHGTGDTRNEDGTVAYSPITKKMAVRYIRCKNAYEIFLGTPVDCVKTKYRGDSACTADRGNPMVCRHQGVWYQVGMYAAHRRIDGCRGPDAAVINLLHFRQWIVDTIQ